MKLNTNQMTAQIPSGFGMPICGHATSATRTAGTAWATSVVRDRRAGDVFTGDMGEMGLPPYVLGTTAWSPPTS